MTRLLHGRGFEPAPFILLNLLFSAVAFYTEALVIIAQKAQTRTDRANEEAAPLHREQLSRGQLNLLQTNTEPTQEIHALVTKLSNLTDDIHAAVCEEPSGRRVILRALDYQRPDQTD